MTTPPPLDTFSTELNSGETIEWSGRPNTSVIFHREDWLMVPFSILWGGFPFFWLFQAFFSPSLHHRPQHFDLFATIIGAGFLVIGQYLIWGRFVYQWWKKKRTSYALTNLRALIVVDIFRRRTATSAFFDRLSIVDKQVRSDGIGAISFGGPVVSQLGFGNRRTTPRPPTFDDIDNADSVYQLAMRLQDQASKLGASTFR